MTKKLPKADKFEKIQNMLAKLRERADNTVLIAAEIMECSDFKSGETLSDYNKRKGRAIINLWRE